MRIIKTIVLLFLFCCLSQSSIAQPDDHIINQNYQAAYDRLSKMLELGSNDFEAAVYYVENAYYGDSLSYEWFHHEIKALATLANMYVRTNHFLYNLPDSADVAKCAGVFKVMTDSIAIAYGDTIIYHHPYTYNFSDFDGSASWPDMFVTTLLATHKGNCHSMPYLYKMIAQELGGDAYLALAPNHVYIKTYSLKDGWYNTELTSADFPLDAWIMASGYVHLNAVQNAVYMDTVGNTKAIAMCLIDLAQGYEQKAANNKIVDSFILKCCATTLHYFPNYMNAMLLQSKIYERCFERELQASGAASPQDFINTSVEAKLHFDEMTTLTQRIHDIGYRRMPTKMYLEWLAVLKTQRDKYSNKKITTFTK